MDKKNKSTKEEDNLIWQAVNNHAEQFKRVDKNTFILFVLVCISLLIAILK